jgi:hypothetical protein
MTRDDKVPSNGHRKVLHALGISALRRVLRCTLMLSLLSLPAFGDGTCSKITNYRVVGQTLVLMYCEDGSPQDIHTSLSTLYSLDTTNIAELPFQVTAEQFPGSANWVILTLIPRNQNIQGLEGSKKYRVVVRYPATSAKGTSLDIDTTNTITVRAVAEDSTLQNFEAISHVGFRIPGHLTVTLHKFAGDEEVLQLESVESQYVSSSTVRDDVVQLEPENIGKLRFTTQKSLKTEQQLDLLVGGLSDNFNQIVKVDETSKIKAAPAPSTKESASYYFKIDYAAGTGATPAWVFDAKVSPLLATVLGGWHIAPDLEADIGNSTISGIKYTDTVHLGATISHGNRGSGLVQYILTTVGPTYETDKELDRHNLLGTVDFMFNAKGLYEPRKYRTVDRYDREKADPKNANANIKLEDVKPVFWGYGLDTHIGLEAGGALVDTTAKASVGKATIDLPSYSIVRPRPQVHAFLELGAVTVDAKAVGRYLVETENTVQELKDHSLVLRPVSGWKGYTEVGITWMIDPTSHIGVNAAYKNGFTPPKFNRVNTIQLGVLIRY